TTGESFTLGVTFTPDKLGLERALIQVTTNDPNQPVLHFTAVGTGLDDVVVPDWSNDFVAIETPNLAGSFPLRAHTDDRGNFTLVLPPGRPFHIVAFDPKTGLVAHGYGTTPLAGMGLNVASSLIFDASTAPDTDGDGLPDDIEFAVGTSPKNALTFGDGID